MLNDTMKLLPLILVVLGAAMQPATRASSQAGPDEGGRAIEGTWLSEDGEAAIQLIACDEGICGEIVWLQEPTDDAGTIKHDINNPEPALRPRPIIGLRLLYGFRPDGPGRWTGGRIYDPNNGKSYRCKMELEDAGATLKIRGYVLTPLFGRTTRWLRTELDELPSPMESRQAPVSSRH